MSDHERIGKIESVEVNGRVFTGRVYHVRRNGWACIEQVDRHIAEQANRHIASGPAPREPLFDYYDEQLRAPRDVLEPLLALTRAPVSPGSKS